jgi:hypothetical protein
LLAMAADPVRIEVELERGSEPIEGLLRHAHGESVPFTGWLELICAIEGTKAQLPGPETAQPRSRPPDPP